MLCSLLYLLLRYCSAVSARTLTDLSEKTSQSFKFLKTLGYAYDQPSM
jgi:hypothetical protein